MLLGEEHVSDPELMKTMTSGLIASVALGVSEEKAEVVALAMLQGSIDALLALALKAALRGSPVGEDPSRTLAAGLERTAALIRARGLLGAAAADEVAN
jgi:tRNA(Ile2) C34 agmatinyltransferase TiaS